jgi:dolichol kinase
MEILELRRQVFHFLFGIVIVILLNFNLINVSSLLFIFAIGVMIALISAYKRLPFFSWMLDVFERKDALFPGQGAILYFVGIILSVWFFPRNIALGSIMILAVGDSIGPIVGKTLGKRKSPVNARFVEGILAGILCATLAAMFFVSFWHAFIASVVSLLIESLELKYLHRSIDDNIYIPLIAGIVLVLLEAL